MRKNVILVICFMCASLLVAREKNKKNGTYVPVVMYEEIENTKSYFKGIEASNLKNLYTVICITNEGILSNDKFHDSFKLNEKTINFSFKQKKAKSYLLDEETGILYIKISDSEKYYDVYNSFLVEKILDKLAISNVKIEKQESKIFLNNTEFFIDKDQWHYSEGINLILYSADKSMFIGLCEENGKILAYALKNGEELEKVIDKVLPN